MQRHDIFCRMVKVDFASHSPQMEPLRADLLQALEGLQPQAESTPIYSTVTGAVSDAESRQAIRTIALGVFDAIDAHDQTSITRANVEAKGWSFWATPRAPRWSRRPSVVPRSAARAADSS